MVRSVWVDNRLRVRLAFYTTGVAAVAALALLLLGRGVAVPPVPVLALFAALAVVGEWMAIPLVQGGYQTFGGAVTLPAVVLLGPIPAALVAAFGMGVGNGLLRRRPLQVTIFNMAQRVLSVLLAGWAWSSLAEGRPVFDHPSFPPLAGEILPPVLGIVLVYSLVTALQVSTYVSAARQRPFWSVLPANAVWQVPVAMVAGASGLAIALLFAKGLPETESKFLIPLLIGSLVALLSMLYWQLVRESADLHAALTDLLRTLDLHELLNRLADKVERLAVPDTVGIFLRGPNDRYQIGLARGIAPEALKPFSTDLGEGVTKWVLAHRRPLRITDYTRDPRRRPETEAILGAGRVRAALIVPLLAGDELLGILALTKHIAGYFTAHQERIITTLAAQAALAVKHAQIYEASRRALARVEALQQLARTATAGADLSAIQQTIVDLAVTTLGAHRGVLALYDEHDRVLIGSAFHNYLPDDSASWRTPVPGNDWRFWGSLEAFRTMQPVAIADKRELPGAPPSLPPSPFPAVLAVPMSVKGRAIGTIAIGRSDRHEWTAQEIDLLQALANEGAVAIENARLSGATHQQLQQMKALETISERINSQHDLHAIFELIAESAREVLRADRCGIYLVGDGTGPLQMFARGLPDEQIDSVMTALQAGTGPVGLAMRSREPVIVSDVLSDPRAEPIREGAKRVGYRTLAAFPLRYRDGVIGVLGLYHDTIHPYGPTEVALGAAFANQAAIAVQNTRLLQEAESKAHQVTLLNRIVTRVTTLLRPEDLFETLVGELHTTLKYPFVTILLVENDRLKVMAYRGYKNLPKTFGLTEGVVGRTARTGLATLVQDVSRDPDYVAADPAVTQDACVPIIQNGRVIGVINIEVVEPTLTRANLDLLTTLAGEVTAAIRNAALFAEVQQARDELQALYESAQTLSASLELSTILEALISVTCRRFGYDYGAILLVDSNAGDLVAHAAYGDAGAIGRRVAVGQGAEGRAAQGARPVLIPDITWDPLETSALVQTGSKLAIPLLREDRVIGVFSVGVSRPGVLGERDQRVLTTLAGYAVVTIENAQLYEQTRYLATTDGLTGLMNHRTFRETLEQELERARRYGLPLSLIMIEIDRFKRYNDTYGHLRGDDVLRLVARILEREHRQQVDVVSRYGGDEFMILLPHSMKPAAAELAERIRRTVEATPFIVGDKVTSVTLSLGVASYPEDGETTDALMEAADRRMYAAKQAGGNAVQVTTSS